MAQPLAVACGGGVSPTAEREISVVGELVVDRRLAERPEGVADAVPLFGASDLALVEGGFVVVDTGNHRIVRFTWNLEPREEWGRRGRGPGEFEGPMAVARSDSLLFVADPANRRISAFDASTGGFRHSVSTRDPVARLTVGPTGGVFFPREDPAFYLTRIRPGGAAGPFARVPAELRFPAESDAPPLGTRRAAISGDGTIHVLDEQSGSLLSYAETGDLLRQSRLPFDLWKELHRRAAGLAEAYRRSGYRMLGSPVAKRLIATGANQLLILYSGEKTVGLLIDAATHEAFLIRRPSRERARTDLWRLSAALLSGDTLLGLYGDALSTFRLRPAR